MAPLEATTLMDAFGLAVQAAAALVVSHGICCSIIMYYDLSGKWAEYTLHKTRAVTLQDYMDGYKSFAADLVLLFLPCMTLCYWYSFDKIQGTYAQ